MHKWPLRMTWPAESGRPTNVYFMQTVLHIILVLWSVNRYYLLRWGKVPRSNKFRKHCIKFVTIGLLTSWWIPWILKRGREPTAFPHYTDLTTELFFFPESPAIIMQREERQAGEGRWAHVLLAQKVQPAPKLWLCYT